jgi:hypothetical protein
MQGDADSGSRASLSPPPRDGARHKQARPAPTVQPEAHMRGTYVHAFTRAESGAILSF